MLIIKMLPPGACGIPDNSGPVSRFKHRPVVTKQGVEIPSGVLVLTEREEQRNRGGVFGAMFCQALEVHKEQVMPVIRNGALDRIASVASAGPGDHIASGGGAKALRTKGSVARVPKTNHLCIGREGSLHITANTSEQA